MSRVENNALFVAKREREREFVSSSVLPPELLFLRFVLLLKLGRKYSYSSSKLTKSVRFIFFFFQQLYSTKKQKQKMKKRQEDKAQRSEDLRNSKEGSMSPIDLSKFTDEEYIAPPQHQKELHNDHIHQHCGEQQQASEDAMDWLDQATNTTHYFADPLDTFMQNFQNANAGAGGSSEDADYGGVQAHETHFSLDSRIFENDSQPETSGVHVDAFNFEASGPAGRRQHNADVVAANTTNKHGSLASSSAVSRGGSGCSTKATTSAKKPSSSSSKSKSSNKSNSNNNNNNNNNSDSDRNINKNYNSSVQRSTSFTKPRKTSSFKKSNLSGVKKASSHVDLTSAFTDLEQGMMHLNSNQIQPGVMRRIPSELRMQQLARYREKRARRRLGHKKIRYECRKTLADNRPRFKGRFAKIIPTVASEGNLSTMSAPEPGEGMAAMNDVLDSMEAKSKDPGDEGGTLTKTEQQTKKENVIKNANEKAAAATRKTRAETTAAVASKKTRANSNSKGSEETNDSETAESDLFSIEIPKRTRAMRRLQSNARGLRASQSEVSLVKLVES